MLRIQFRSISKCNMRYTRVELVIHVFFWIHNSPQKKKKDSKYSIILYTKVMQSTKLSNMQKFSSCYIDVCVCIYICKDAFGF